MALARRSSQRFNTAIWPGFVDAMTGLLLVLMFVLTIFMVIQFVLRETITGQESELDALSSEIAILSSTLGLAEAENAQLNAGLDAAAAEAAAQAALIATLTEERDETAAALRAAENAITGFEARVAGLLAERDTANATVATLEEERATLLSEQEQLNLALATARDEIDAGEEAARLAAARREALEALVADLESERDAQSETLSEIEAAQLADAAAAEAIRERLANADAELTAMTLALEEKRREAEETLTLLAAAEAVKDNLDLTIATALSAQAAAEAALANAQSESATLEEQLNAALLAQQNLQAQISGENDPDALREALAAALAAKLAQEAENERLATQLESQQSAADRQAILLAVANSALQQEEALSAESQREVAVLNAQVAELRQQISNLQSLLNLATENDVDARIQIQELGTQLNTALARVAAEERRRAALEEAERTRLEEEAARLAAEAQNLERFRSDFFGQLRDVLEGQDGVRIEGDRFVFSSEVLFQPGQAELSAQGRAEITKIAAILQDIADEIPQGIDWIIRVDGHTDDLPLSGTGRFRDNWELSQGRALSVVRYMEQSLGIPPNRLAANGFGEFQPLNPADTPEARAQNRRIELKLTER
ncbi:chemotaxis protein MotB [Cognatiyoonia koreensis]|uniref:Chemotaxis protein MotB n=1 Tax=Cognatiyoonia koreensis TaxID=364200 RepID=A0A1I0MVD3_9RHOB|nr:peptidoglycan -binding protein [Cognatiyoonia koreensis]SEV92743.1 chemotaxis protein MotB [Cognatiyoonia koreensis]